MTVAPGHFHAALVQKRMVPAVHPRSYLYGPLDADTVAHVERLAGFNNRDEQPTAWEVDVRAGGNWLARYQREMPGNTVVLSGRNRPKIDLMRSSVAGCVNVLADKPWVVEHEDFPRVEELYHEADLREVLVLDVMTERHEVTNRLQRELIRDPSVFGQWQAGTPMRPALVLESVHHLKKTVAGRPLVRPWWWFDPATSGEAMADVGTHLADLALWIVAQDRAVDYRTDVHLLTADAWPLLLSEEEFCAVTALPGFPAGLHPHVVQEQLYYAGNNSVTLTLCGVHVEITTRWEYEAAPGGGDTHAATALGTRARVEVRQQPGQPPDVFVTALHPSDHAGILRRLNEKCEILRERFPGLAVRDLETEIQMLLPEVLRTGHEAHFAAVLEEFARYFHNPRAVPAWERPNTVAKYFITTKAVEMARGK